VPPFHSWLIRVLGELKPIFIFFLFTVQKLVPFFILSQLKISERVRSLFLLLRFLFILTRLNKITSFYVLIFFSSVVNTLWTLISLSSGGVWFGFIIIYSIMLISLIGCIECLSSFKLVDVGKVGSVGGVLLSYNFLNLGGLPPLVGFLAKVSLIKSLVDVSILTVIGLIGSSLLVLYLYVVFRYQRYALTKEAVPSFIRMRSEYGFSLVVSLFCRGLILWLLQ